MRLKKVQYIWSGDVQFANIPVHSLPFPWYISLTPVRWLLSSSTSVALNLGGETSSLAISQTLIIPMVSAVYRTAEEAEDKPASNVIASTGRLCAEIDHTDRRGSEGERDDRSL